MSNVYVIGAGVVGVSCALNLLEKGFDVTLIERNDNVLETSFGNAGVIARSSAYLINNKNLIPSLKKYVFNKHPAVRMSYSYLLKNVKWASNFLFQSLQEASEKNIKSLDSIIQVALSEHKKWLTASGQIHRLRDTGWLKIYRSPDGAQAARYEQAIYKQLGVEFELLNAQQLQVLEPAIAPVYGSAIYIKSAASVDSPSDVTQGYLDHFLSLGGKLVRDDVTSLVRQNLQICIKAKDADYFTDQVVLAAGPWSNDVLKTIAKPLPMGFERGYHEHYEIPEGPQLTRPIYDVDGAFVLTPMTHGYRLTSGSELKDKDMPASPDQLSEVAKSAQQMLRLGKLVPNSVWKGNRPTLPDSLPAIGPCPHVDGLWLAFGHQHIGFSTGPATGRLLAEMMVGQDTFIDSKPFSPDRFK